MTNARHWTKLLYGKTKKHMKNQKKNFRKDYTVDGKPETIIAEVRHDDGCRNGHNTFSITGTIYTTDRQPGETTIKHTSGELLWCNGGGCIHDEIAEHFPELAPFIKWHLTSTDEPMHYVANTVYHAEQGKLDCARSTAVWPEATDMEIIALQKEGRLSTVLLDRLPALMAQFKAAVESLGFTY